MSKDRVKDIIYLVVCMSEQWSAAAMSQVHRDWVGENLFMVVVTNTRMKENMTMMSMAKLVVCRNRVEENLFIW